MLVEPAHRSAPPFSRTLGDEVADLAELAGFPPDPEQRLGLDLLFALDGAGRSAAFEFCVVCARQNLKTGLFKQAALGWLFLLDQPLVVWSAHEFRTSQEAFRDMEQLIGGCASLSRRLKKVYYGSGDEAIELKSGQRLIFKARTSSGGRGLSGSKVVLDEAFALRPDHMGALLPTLSVQPDPQIVYGSSAGLAHSAVLRGIRDRGRAGSSPRLAYLEWGAPPGGCRSDPCSHRVGEVDGCALDDVRNWQLANPLLGRVRVNGTGLSVEYVAAERQALPPEEFARERLGWWDEAGAADVFGPGRWEAGQVESRPPELRIDALGLAVSFDLSRASVGAVGGVGDVTFVKTLRHGVGSSWVVDATVELYERHAVPVAVDGRGPAAPLIPGLQQAGVDVVVMSTADVLDACGALFSAVSEGRLLHETGDELDDAVAAVVKRPVGDRWAWGRRASASDISPLEAVTLAARLAAVRQDLEPFALR